MNLTGSLKTKADNTAAKEEKTEAVKNAGTLLTDDELEMVSGGMYVQIVNCCSCGRRGSDYCEILCPHR